MEYEKIVKAFGICFSEHLGCEDGCPYVEVPCLGGNTLLKDALALVKKKDTEIDILIRKNETLKDENFELKAEVEKYRHIEQTVKDFWSELKKMSAFKNLQEPTLTELLEYINAEAIKEFAERLKQVKVYSFERKEKIVPVSAIDWIAKELTE